MNIFATHKDPIEAAKWLWDLDPVRGRKMVVESAQLLSYWLHRKWPINADELYKKDLIYKYHKSYANGMFTSWLLKSDANVWWLYDYGRALLSRHGKGHKSIKVYDNIAPYTIWFDTQLSPFVHYAQAKSKPEFSVTPEQCPDVHKAYRIYLKRQVLKDPGYWEE